MSTVKAEIRKEVDYPTQSNMANAKVSTDTDYLPDLKPTTSKEKWYLKEVSEVLKFFRVDANEGLSESEVTKRQQQYGLNELQEQGLKSPGRILWEQISAVMILVLIGAAAVKAVVAIIKNEPREWIDMAAILAIVILNVVLGFVQEYRAERAMAALKKMAAPLVRVLRKGTIAQTSSTQLVPGDIVLLEAGNMIPADLRVVSSINLRVQEASLTGESLPVDKRDAALVGNDILLGDRANMLYFGTSVTYGRGSGVVVATGMQTELGTIASLIQGVKSEQTPLQRRITQLGTALALAILVIVALMVLLGALRGESVLAMFLAGVAIAVAAIPEGLPAVMTITLALGAQRMLKRRALIRKLPAVETLGSITTICSDKTGTLTENKMQVTRLHTLSNQLELRTRESVKVAPDLTLLLSAGLLCNDALVQAKEGQETDAIGDPTEVAILLAGTIYGMEKRALETFFPRVAEAAFSSERKRMTTVHGISINDPNIDLGFAHLFADQPLVAFTKGSADGILAISDRVLLDGEEQPITTQWQREMEAAVNAMAEQGLRVLGVAYRSVRELPEDIEKLEDKLVFVGLIGMIDPPRAEVKAAVQTCLHAGIRPVMITGDHPLTACEIARQLHIVSGEKARILTGKELAQMTPTDLEAVVEDVAVYARVSPQHKLNIVQALQKKGHVVAMTGDGVNDAPALRKSDIGVAMGITGTDVSKEASDMVITDDNFTTIVSAIEEGRTIYENIRKFVKYIVTSNSAEVTVMLLTQLVGMPIPMTTLQILWMNLVTDGLPGLALGLEPKESDVMSRKPFAPNESIFSRGIGLHIVIMGAILAAVSFTVGYWAYHQYGATGPWGTMVFMTLTLSQLGQAMAVRSTRESLFKIGLRGNPLLLIAVVLTLLLQLTIVYLPPLQSLFNTQPLGVYQLLICLVASTAIFWAVEIEKWLVRRQNG